MRHHMMNPRSRQATTDFNALQAEIAQRASESAQINAVVSALAAMGYANAATPEVSQTSVDRSTYRIYLWRDTPFGDHLVLATGPSFEPSLLLASTIPNAPQTPGFYVHALIAQGDVKALSGASRAARGASTAREDVEKAKAAKAKAEAKAARADADRAEADRRAAEQRADRERAERHAAEERARAERERADRERAEREVAETTTRRRATTTRTATKSAEDAEKEELKNLLAGLLG
jgi:hypothetical protein